MHKHTKTHKQAFFLLYFFFSRGFFIFGPPDVWAHLIWAIGNKKKGWDGEREWNRKHFLRKKDIGKSQCGRPINWKDAIYVDWFMGFSFLPFFSLYIHIDIIAILIRVSILWSNNGKIRSFEWGRKKKFKRGRSLIRTHLACCWTIDKWTSKSTTISFTSVYYFT